MGRGYGYIVITIGIEISGYQTITVVLISGIVLYVIGCSIHMLLTQPNREPAPKARSNSVFIAIVIKVTMLQRALEFSAIPGWVHIKIRYSIIDVSSTPPGMHPLIRYITHKVIVAVAIHVSQRLAAS